MTRSGFFHTYGIINLYSWFGIIAKGVTNKKSHGRDVGRYMTEKNRLKNRLSNTSNMAAITSYANEESMLNSFKQPGGQREIFSRKIYKKYLPN